MELRSFAERVLFSESLAQKLQRDDSAFTDAVPGPPVRVAVPARPDNLQFAPRRTAPAMPKPASFADPARRAVAHHIMANHELQALEVMAMILLAFPEAHPEFRQGLGRVMIDEQRHTRMHAQRCEELGLQFGDLPVNCYIWSKAAEYTTVLQYIAGLPLVFEGRNLDHTVEFENHFRTAGDRRSAAIMRAIHKDEIRHVEFGMTWLRRLKPPELTDFEAWQQNLLWPIRPSKAIGDQFQKDARLQAGMSPEFIDQLVHWSESDADPIANEPTRWSAGDDGT
ncbi:MAG: ferritin-like domain-containing protein [Planctomycetaceae bacterium]